MTLFKIVTNDLYYHQYTQDLSEDYVEDIVNKMTNFELLKAISDAMENLRREE